MCASASSIVDARSRDKPTVQMASDKKFVPSRAQAFWSGTNEYLGRHQATLPTGVHVKYCPVLAIFMGGTRQVSEAPKNWISARASLLQAHEGLSGPGKGVPAASLSLSVSLPVCEDSPSASRAGLPATTPTDRGVKYRRYLYSASRGLGKWDPQGCLAHF